MSELDKIDDIIKNTKSIFDDYLKSYEEKIKEIPKLAFLSLYKSSQKYNTRSLGEISSRKSIKLVTHGVWNGVSCPLYLDCKKIKFVTYNSREFSNDSMLSTYLNNKKRFDIDKIYNKFLISSREELSDEVFSVTKTLRRNSQETALNYFIYILNKSDQYKINITFEDLKIYIGSNKILNDFLKSKEDFQKIRNEMTIRTATALLKK